MVALAPGRIASASAAEITPVAALLMTVLAPLELMSSRSSAWPALLPVPVEEIVPSLLTVKVPLLPETRFEIFTASLVAVMVAPALLLMVKLPLVEPLVAIARLVPVMVPELSTTAPGEVLPPIQVTGVEPDRVAPARTVR